ncbi:hypothetical protein JCM9279_001796 [Rhodotorula babjevae]
MDHLAPSPLASALSTNSQLRAQLTHAHTRLEQRKRLRQLDDERTPDTSPHATRSRERDLEHRLASLQGQLARQRAQAALEHGIHQALDHSHLVSTHLCALPPSTPASPDQLDKLSALKTQRALLRRDLLRLNRRNAQLVADLRAKHTLADPALHRAARRALPAPTAEYLSRLETELPILHARLATLQTLLSRLLPKCGLPAPPSSSSSTVASRALSIPERVARIEDELLASPAAAVAPRDDERRPWSARKTWDVLLLAGDGAGLDPSGSSAPEPGFERDQVLPARIVERAEAWQRARAAAKAAGWSTPARSASAGGKGGGGTARRSGEAGRGGAGTSGGGVGARSSASKGRSRTLG